MSAMSRRRFVAATAAALAAPVAFVPRPARAAEHEVRMLNVGESGIMVFEPALLRIASGDSVTFVPVDPGHNAESIRGMLPEGARPFRGALDKPVTTVFTEPGVYGIVCLPHLSMGMVALIVVDDPSPNLEAAKAVATSPRAQARFDAMFAELEAGA
jgi:pseudoazurin